eukprot:TRINITY_DN3806_c0_g1_i1.p1 TRINITY_DN3806_c0_g1~~TRINITY_DN3806_c0_g1_i1.p1  ORF type:complete len:936 (+),score=169.91 TRINITY_DN3806_c0_g1_i1:66-2873(+)
MKPRSELLAAYFVLCILSVQGATGGEPSQWWSQWLRTSSLPNPVARCSSVSSKGMVYVGGGEPDADRRFYKLGLDDMNWEVLSDMPNGVTGDNTMIVYQDKLIYVFSEGGMMKNDVAVQEYNPQDGRWTIVDNSSTTVTKASVAFFQDLVYVIGGVAGDGRELDTVRIYDPAKKTWFKGPNLPYTIQQAAVAVSDKLYVIGGKRNDVWINDMTSLADPSSKWDASAPDIPAQLGHMPYPDSYVIGSYLWVFGNRYEDPGPQMVVFIFDLYQEEWDSIRVEGLQASRARYAGCSTAVTGNGKGNLFIFGGLELQDSSNPTDYADLLQASIYPVVTRNGTHNGGYWVGDTLAVTITQVSPASKYTFRISSSPSCLDNAGGTLDKGWDGYKNQVKFIPSEPVEEAYLCFSTGRCPAKLRRDCLNLIQEAGLAFTRSSCAGVGCCWEENNGQHGQCFHKVGEDENNRLEWMTPLLWGEPFAISFPPNNTDIPATMSPPTTAPSTDEPEPSQPTESPQTSDSGMTSDDILVLLVIVCCLLICACGWYITTVFKKTRGNRDSLPVAEVGDDTTTHNYKILKKLGSGGYGYVFSVQRKCDGKIFAMKYIIIDSDEERRDALLEFETMRGLQGHPNIINLVDMFMSWSEGPGAAEEVSKQTDLYDSENLVQQATMRRYVCIVMDFYEAGDLKTYLMAHREPISEPTIWYIASEVTAALEYMHSQVPPVMHRDLKPENLLISDSQHMSNGYPTPTVVITDLGLARGMSEQTYCQTQAGSLPYVAPECWQRRYSVKVDMWALGCILYAVCTLRIYSNNTRVMFSDATKPNFSQELLAELQGCGYSRELAGLILKLLNPDPHVRPAVSDCRACINNHLLKKFGVEAKPIDTDCLQQEVKNIKRQAVQRQPAVETRNLQEEEDYSTEGSYLLNSESHSSSARVSDLE